MHEMWWDHIMEYFPEDVTCQLHFKGWRINRSQLFEMGIRAGEKGDSFPARRISVSNSIRARRDHGESSRNWSIHNTPLEWRKVSPEWDMQRPDPGRPLCFITQHLDFTVNWPWATRATFKGLHWPVQVYFLSTVV